jgi:hypothetical protein
MAAAAQLSSTQQQTQQDQQQQQQQSHPSAWRTHSGSGNPSPRGDSGSAAAVAPSPHVSGAQPGAAVPLGPTCAAIAEAVAGQQQRLLRLLDARTGTIAKCGRLTHLRTPHCSAPHWLAAPADGRPITLLLHTVCMLAPRLALIAPLALADRPADRHTAAVAAF